LVAADRRLGVAVDESDAIGVPIAAHWQLSLRLSPVMTQL